MTKIVIDREIKEGFQKLSFQGNAYEIKILLEVYEYDERENIKIWINENIKGSWAANTQGKHISYWFNEKNDLIHFKLKWYRNGKSK